MLHLSTAKSQAKIARLSYHIRNVPGLSTIEMSPGCGFTMPKKKLVSSSVDSGFFSKDDRQRARKIFDLGMGARGKGQRLFPRSSL